MAWKVACLLLLLAHGAGAVRTNGTNEEEVEVLPLQKGMQVDDYVLETQLGTGADGEVWKALDTSSSEFVAVKFVELDDPEQATAFQNEAKVIQVLRECSGYPHPNVINIHKTFKKTLDNFNRPGQRRMTTYHSGKHIGVIAMELAQGGPLNSKLYKCVSAEQVCMEGERLEFGTELLIDESKAKGIFAQLASGVQFLAKCGIVHQDLKPDNIMVDESSGKTVLKIGDFGRSVVVGSRGAALLPNMFYRYEAGPNQNRPFRFDVFGLGMLLAEIGTGVPPFFNPPYDYYSTRGNLKDQCGIIFAYWPMKKTGVGGKQVGRQSKENSVYPAIDALSKNADYLKKSVGEVAGRQMYYYRNEKNHFTPSIAVSDDHGEPINEDFKNLAWIYTSPQAWDLLQRLITHVDNRLDPTAVCQHPWLDGKCDETLRQEQPRNTRKPLPAPQDPRMQGFTGYQDQFGFDAQRGRGITMKDNFGGQDQLGFGAQGARGRGAPMKGHNYPGQDPQMQGFTGYQDQLGFGAQGARDHGVTMKGHNYPGQEPLRKHQQPPQNTNHQEDFSFGGRVTRAQTMVPKGMGSQDVYDPSTGKKFEGEVDGLGKCSGAYSSATHGKGGPCEVKFIPALQRDCLLTLMCPKNYAHFATSLEGVQHFIARVSPSDVMAVPNCNGCVVQK